MKTILRAALLLALAAPAGAQAPRRLTLAAGLGGGAGDVTYRIGGRLIENGVTDVLPMPISELEFPLDVTWGNLRAGYDLGGGWEVRGRIAMNLDEDAGTFKDSDWEIPEAPDLLTTYSESDTEFDGWQLDLAVQRWWKARGGAGWNGAVGLGWRRDDLQWDSKNTAQIGLADVVGGVPVFETAYYPDTAVSFASELSMPFAELSAEYRRGRARLELRAGGAPYVQVTQTDDHTLRGIRSDADLEGWGWFGEAGATFDLTDTWFAGARFEVVHYEADGDSDAQVYGGYDPDLAPGSSWTIEQEMESSSATVFLEVGCRL